MMSKCNVYCLAGALTVFLPLSPIGAAAREIGPVFRLAMMDMMPMGDNKMPPSMPGGAPGMGGKMGMGDDKMPPSMPGGAPGMGGKMGGDKMPAGGGMPAPGPAQTQTGGCGMMEMMQNMKQMAGSPAGMAPMQGGAMADGMQPAADSAPRLEGRIAFLRTELRITDVQAPAWEAFATALRGGRGHLDAARAALQESNANPDAMARMTSFETHLKERAEAIHSTQSAFMTLFSQLDDAQKKTANTTMLPFIGAF